ncbi:MAG: hypothetical protein WAT70_03505 [Rhizobiaceae bacterium]
MGKLFWLVYIMVASALAGIAVTAILSLGRFDGMQIIYAAVAGAILAIPLTLFVARKISTLR